VRMVIMKYGCHPGRRVLSDRGGGDKSGGDKSSDNKCQPGLFTPPRSYFPFGVCTDPRFI
jgi:hypothetical protein